MDIFNTADKRNTLKPKFRKIRFHCHMVDELQESLAYERIDR